MQGYTHSAPAPITRQVPPRPLLQAPDRLIAVTWRCPYTLPYGRRTLYKPTCPCGDGSARGGRILRPLLIFRTVVIFHATFHVRWQKPGERQRGSGVTLKQLGKWLQGCIHTQTQEELRSSSVCLTIWGPKNYKKDFYSLVETLSPSQSLCISYWWIMYSHGFVCSANRVLLPLLYVSRACYVCAWKGREVCSPCLWLSTFGQKGRRGPRTESRGRRYYSATLIQFSLNRTVP